jgi:hypothetical protein
MGILSCDEITFPKEPNVGSVIVRITGFTSLIIIGFDLHVAEVGDLAIGIMHSRFFMKATIWIKTRVYEMEGSGQSFRSKKPSFLHHFVALWRSLSNRKSLKKYLFLFLGYEISRSL